MTTNEAGKPPVAPVLYFGKHKGQPLSTIPTSYLAWALRAVKLSSGLRASVVGELQRRGVQTPAPPPAPPRTCHRCGSAEVRCCWYTFANGIRHLHGDCTVCGKNLGSLPQTPERIAEADRNASPTALLDLLTEADAAGVTVRRIGDQVVLEPWQRVTPRLRDLLRQAGFQASRMVTQ